MSLTTRQRHDESASETECGERLRGFLHRLVRLLVEGVDALPVVLHVDERPPLCLALIERLVELADVRGAVVGPFAFRVGVPDDAGKARAGTARRPFEHLLIAV